MKTIMIRSITLLVAFVLMSCSESGPSGSEVRNSSVTHKPQDITFTLYADQSVTPEVFTWSADGAIEDEGNWADLSVLWSAVRSPVVGGLHDRFILTGERGTLTLQFDGLLTPTADPNIFQIDGNWRILSATGDYAGTNGQGKGAIEINFSATVASTTLSGQIKF